MKIYIACALTHVPRDKFSEHVSFIHELAASLKGIGHDVKYALTNSDPQLAGKPIEDRARLCYAWDRKMVEEAELVVGEASFASIGLGIELQIAEQKDTPIILCFRDYGDNRVLPVDYENPDHTRHHLQIGEGFITLMALGLPSLAKVMRYGSKDDGIQRILAAVKLLSQD